LGDFSPLRKLVGRLRLEGGELLKKFVGKLSLKGKQFRKFAGRQVLFGGEGKRAHNYPPSGILFKLFPSPEEPVNGSVLGRQPLNQLTNLFLDLPPQMLETPRGNFVGCKLEDGSSHVGNSFGNHKNHRKTIFSVVMLKKVKEGIL
jgi:hypothetical protein